MLIWLLRYHRHRVGREPVVRQAPDVCRVERAVVYVQANPCQCQFISFGHGQQFNGFCGAASDSGRVARAPMGAFVGAIGGSVLAMDGRASGARGPLGEPALVDYAVAASLPVAGFLVLWGAVRVLVWIWAGFSEQPSARGRGHAAGR